MVAPIYKEWLILSTVIFQRVGNGFMQGLPAILTPVITSEDSDIRVTKEEASWLTAIGPMLGIIGFLYLPSLMQKFGRRFTNAYLNIIALTGTIIIASSANFTWLLVGRGIQGTIFCQSLITGIIVAEYSHPKRRGIVITLTVVSTMCGVALCHGLSAILTWRQICWLFTTQSIMGLVSTMLWAESPSWLAYKGRYRECEDAFRWLRGDDPESMKELEELITTQRDIKHRKESDNSVKSTLKTMCTKEFLKPIFIITIGGIFTEASGVHYITSYLFEIMTKLTGSKSNALYFSLGVDLIKVLAVVISTDLVRRFKRRALIRWSGTLSIFVLVLTCMIDFLQERNILIVPWLPATILILYCFITYFAVPVITIVKGEIFPIEYKGLGVTISGVLQTFIVGLMLKATSNMLESLQTYGTFIVFSIIMSGSLALYIFNLPETKDRTLQNIENELLGLKLPKDECDFEMATILKK